MSRVNRQAWNRSSAPFYVAEDRAEESRQYVSFLLNRDEFAVDISEVQEIAKLSGVRRMPRSPGFVEGVINLRGKIVPLINLRERFHIEKAGYDRYTRVIVISVRDRWIGLIVDSVSEALRIPSRSIQEAPAEAVSEDVEFIKGIADHNNRLIVILNMQKVMSAEEIDILAGIKNFLQIECAPRTNST